MLAANGAMATLTFGTYSLSYTFTGPLNTGMLGVGTNNSIANFTSYTVRKLPVTFTYSVLEDLSDGVANNFTPQTGTWTTTSGTSGRYYAVPPSNDAAISTRPLAVAPFAASMIELFLFKPRPLTVSVATSVQPEALR